MTNALSIYLIDTNVLVYMYDQAEPDKRDRAMAIYARLLAQGTGALSVQILGEFFNATTRKLRPALPIGEAIEAVTDLRRGWTVFDLNPRMVLDAVRAVEAYRLSYYDALIWATARYHDVPFLLSEDLNGGQVIEGVEVVNPFASDFDMALLS